MNVVERKCLRSAFQERRTAIAMHWFLAITGTSYTSLSAAAMLQQLTDLVSQAVDTLLAEPFEPQAAQEIGAAMAQLRFVQAETLGSTFLTLAQQFTADLPEEAAYAFQPRLHAFLAMVAAGFVRRVDEITLAEQEGIRQSLLAEHKRTIKALREREKQLRLVVGSVPIILFTLDREGVFTMAGGQGLDVFGNILGIATGCSIYMLEQCAFPIQKYFQRAIAGEAFMVIVEIAQRDFEIRFAPLGDVQGHVRGVSGMALDITERRKIAALRESEAKYRLLVEHIPAITYIAALDEASSTRYASPQVEAMLGFPQADWMADPTLWYTRIHPDDQARILTELKQGRASGNPAPSEYRMFTRAGKLVWFREECAIMHDEAGQPLYLYGVMFDITERKRLEAELADIRHRLDERVETERLHLAHELHDHSVQQLIGLSYQIVLLQRQQASAPAWPSNELAQENLNATLQDLHHNILEVIGQLRTLVGDLRPVGLDDLGVISALDGYLARLRRTHKGDLPRIDVDLNEIEASLPPSVALCLFRTAQEALRNALRHAQAERITLGLYQHGCEIVVIVQDDGCGFQVPDALSKFAQADHFGLIGLNERAAGIGGRLDIRSQTGQGTTVTLRIPLSSRSRP